MTLQKEGRRRAQSRPAPETSTRCAVSGIVMTDHDVLPLAPCPCNGLAPWGCKLAHADRTKRRSNLHGAKPIG